MQFEWDEKKNTSNFEKHGIEFYVAVEVFSDAMGVETTRIINGEERIQFIGKIDDYVFSVVYANRNSNIRIISARFASKKERKYYEQKATIRKI